MVYRIWSRCCGLAFEAPGAWPQLTSPITPRGLPGPTLCQILYLPCGNWRPPEGAASLSGASAPRSPCPAHSFPPLCLRTLFWEGPVPPLQVDLAPSSGCLLHSWLGTFPDGPVSIHRQGRLSTSSRSFLAPAHSRAESAKGLV